MLWTTPQTIGALSFVNGTLAAPHGTFCTSVHFQTTSNGSSWTDLSWTLNPAYISGSNGGKVSYSAQAAGQTLTNIRGVRVVGRVRTSGCSSRYATIAEIMATTPGGVAFASQGQRIDPESIPNTSE